MKVLPVSIAWDSNSCVLRDDLLGGSAGRHLGVKELGVVPWMS